ncbi:hypothetical protein AUR64_18985 [Haloprofundus marisrubri]|uniref:DUF4397 domain-containing protein n=1 Tax=Haloprofundus marisrubri TaxID=1514971 RepID=A0A0W1R4L4_9EURY|nr:hypothetical protein AUR64_18985 [Haloprofundus marisrubri]
MKLLGGGALALGAGTQTAAAQQQTARVRAVHASPDAPAVDVYIDGELVLEGLEFQGVSPYLSVPTGTYQVAVTPAGASEEEAVIDAEVSLQKGNYSLAAIGQVTDGSIRPLVVRTPVLGQVQGLSVAQAVHAAPDAPPVDVTAVVENEQLNRQLQMLPPELVMGIPESQLRFTDEGQAELTLIDGLSFGNVSDTLVVPATQYTLQIRAATPGNDGDVVASVPAALEGGVSYTAYASGYLEPPQEVVDELGNRDFELFFATTQ